MIDQLVWEKDIKKACRILGIGQDATEVYVRRAYLCLAKKYHPDVNPDDPKAEERFKEIQWAYQVLRRRMDKRTNMASGGVNTYPRDQKNPFLSFYHHMREWPGRKKRK